MPSSKENFISKVNQIHRALNIPESFAEDRKLPLQAESSELVEIVCEGSDKIHKLTKSAAEAWSKLDRAAKNDGISLIVVSTYRGLEYQRALIEKKLEKGQDILDILKLLAPPGYSEHHTGRAMDLTTEDCPPCVEHFENTQAFSWLKKNASTYGFSLSYPRDNLYGFVYEPWHWAFKE